MAKIYYHMEGIMELLVEQRGEQVIWVTVTLKGVHRNPSPL